MANFIGIICSTNLFPGDPAEGVSEGEREDDSEHGVASARLVVHVGGGHSPRLGVQFPGSNDSVNIL